MIPADILSFLVLFSVSFMSDCSSRSYWELEERCLRRFQMLHNFMY